MRILTARWPGLSLIQPMWSSRPAYRRWPWEKYTCIHFWNCVIWHRGKNLYWFIIYCKIVFEKKNPVKLIFNVKFNKSSQTLRKKSKTKKTYCFKLKKRFTFKCIYLYCPIYFTRLTLSFNQANLCLVFFVMLISRRFE